MERPVMARDPRNPLQLRWSNGLLPDRFSAADVDGILLKSRTRMAATAYDWAAVTREGQEHLPQRSPQEWAALYLDHAVLALRQSWQTIRLETPVARRDWANAVHDSATALLAHLNAAPGYAPAVLNDIAPSIMALTRPQDKPVMMPDSSIEDATPLLPLLSEMAARSTRPDPYWIHPMEAWWPKISPDFLAAANQPLPPLPRGPLLSDALRIAIAGVQLLALRARILADTAAPDANKRPETGSRAMIYFAQQVGSIYRKLSGENSPFETPPGHKKPHRAEVRFYQGVCHQAVTILRGGSKELLAALRGRAGSHGTATAESDLREAWSDGGGSPRKR